MIIIKMSIVFKLRNHSKLLQMYKSIDLKFLNSEQLSMFLNTASMGLKGVLELVKCVK